VEYSFALKVLLHAGSGLIYHNVDFVVYPAAGLT
jgi:hypothetical protein